MAIRGGLTLTLSTTAPAQLGWSGEPLAWGFGVDTPTPFDVHLADGSTLPMTLSLGISDKDGDGPQAPTMGIILRGPESSWPSPTPPANGTPPPEWTPLPYSRRGPIVMVNLYWTSSPLATESFPPGQGEVVFNGRFAATFDVTFPYVDVQAMFVPSTSVVGPGDISAHGTVSCG